MATLSAIPKSNQILDSVKDFSLYLTYFLNLFFFSVTSSGAAACLSVLSMGTATKKRKTKEMALANEKSHHHQEHAWEPSDIESLLKYVAEHFDHLDKKSASAVCMLMCLSSNPRARTCTCIPRDTEHCANGDQNGVRKHDANVNQNVEGWGKQIK